jgi:hypothetical protein
MQRLRLYDLRISRLPGIVGLCTSDTTGLCSLVNAAQRRLILCPESGDEGWYGTWAEVAFTISRSAPYLTLPRGIARMEQVVVCDQPIPIYNQFWEYLQFGNGRLPKQNHCDSGGCLQEVLSRNSVPTWTDLSNAPQYLRAYPSNDGDTAARIFYQGTDQNNRPIVNLDGADRVQGVFYGLTYPFNTTAEQFSALTGIQKDQTLGAVEVFQVNPTTGEEVLLVTLDPGQTTASYRRYYFNNLPCSCCSDPVTEPQTITLRAICKFEPLPVLTDTDYLVIQNQEAMIEACKAVRYSEMDTVAGKQMAKDAHRNAVEYLNGELTHYYGRDNPSVIVKPYGSADLRNQRIGTMI